MASQEAIHYVRKEDASGFEKGIFFQQICTSLYFNMNKALNQADMIRR